MKSITVTYSKCKIQSYYEQINAIGMKMKKVKHEKWFFFLNTRICAFEKTMRQCIHVCSRWICLLITISERILTCVNRWEEWDKNNSIHHTSYREVNDLFWKYVVYEMNIRRKICHKRNVNNSNTDQSYWMVRVKLPYSLCNAA